MKTIDAINEAIYDHIMDRMEEAHIDDGMIVEYSGSDCFSAEPPYDFGLVSEEYKKTWPETPAILFSVREIKKSVNSAVIADSVSTSDLEDLRESLLSLVSDIESYIA